MTQSVNFSQTYSKSFVDYEKLFLIFRFKFDEIQAWYAPVDYNWKTLEFVFLDVQEDFHLVFEVLLGVPLIINQELDSGFWNINLVLHLDVRIIDVNFVNWTKLAPGDHLLEGEYVSLLPHNVAEVWPSILVGNTHD